MTGYFATKTFVEFPGMSEGGRFLPFLTAQENFSGFGEGLVSARNRSFSK